MKIGFVGQGFVGKNIANDFEQRGFEVVRYALEDEYRGNKEFIRTCDVVFIAVPTPTTPQGFDFSIVEEALALVGEGKTAVIKSTLIPSTTKKLQVRNSHITVLVAPEFLCEATAAHDAAHPLFNIIGMPIDTPNHQSAAQKIMALLPEATQQFVLSSDSAELFKYIHNIHGFMRVVFANIFYDTANILGVVWKDVEQIMNVDPMMSPYYNTPLHKSGRGAGGHCFIKDMAAFSKMYTELLPNDVLGNAVIHAMEEKNLELLKSTQKDQSIVEGVYDTTKE